MAAANGQVISADSHVTEPMELWETRIDKRFRDRAPRYVYDEASKRLNFVVEGQVPRGVSPNIMVGQKPEDYADFLEKGLDAARAGGWDTAARLEDMDHDGIHAAVNRPVRPAPRVACPVRDRGWSRRTSRTSTCR